MKQHKKSCRYCNKQFYSKRIDAFYCSSSCRGMANRCKNNPELYGRLVAIHFELEKGEYKTFKDFAKESGFEINEYAKTLCLSEVSRIKNNVNHERESSKNNGRNG